MRDEPARHSVSTAAGPGAAIDFPASPLPTARARATKRARFVVAELRAAGALAFGSLLLGLGVSVVFLHMAVDEALHRDERAARRTVAQLHFSVLMHAQARGALPASLEDAPRCATPMAPSSGGVAWTRACPVPLDPWGRRYAYDVFGQRSGAGFDIVSAGPDGLFGSADDVGNWDAPQAR